MLKNKTTPVDSYHDTFTSNGHTPEFIPLLNHAPVSIDQTTNYLTSPHFLDDVGRFIITSQRAVEVFHECLERISSTNKAVAETIRSKIGYTVGPATEQILRENGFINVKGGYHAGNGSLLADIILKEVPVSELVVFFTGVIRKDIIPVKLKKNGISVEEVVIYKTEPKHGIVDHFLRCCEEKVDWVVFFSPQGTEDIVQHLVSTDIKETLQHAKIASIGPTTQKYLENMGIVAHVVAPKPTASSLYASLVEES